MNNREIKFNAWLPSLKYMLKEVAVGYGTISFPFIDEPEDDFYQFLKEKGFITDDEENLPDYIYNTAEDWGNITDEKEFILLQFTGLNDKNGNPIYEGDIISNGEEKCLIIWRKDLASFALSKEGWAYDHYFGEAADPGYVEVIGNIYQSPELLKS